MWTVVSAAVLLLAVFCAAVMTSGPFDSLVCRLTFRNVCQAHQLSGFTAPGADSIRAAFETQFVLGESLGAQVYIVHKGSVVADLAGSYECPNYTADSVQMVFSSTKVVSPVVIGLLVDRGLLNYTDPIAKYWPAFGQNGKANITVEDLMKHESGLAFLDEPVPDSALHSPIDEADTIRARIERSRPVWPEGGRRVYHAHTRGWVENEIVKMVDPHGRDMGEVFRDDIARPMRIDYWIGRFPPEESARLAIVSKAPTYYELLTLSVPLLLGTASEELVHAVSLFENSSSIAARALAPRAGWTIDRPVQDWTTLQELHVVSPSVNGVTNARSTSRILQMLAQHGQLEGRRYLSASTVDEMLSNPTTAFDAGLRTTTTFTRGGWSVNVRQPTHHAWFGWGGYGGSMALFCPATNSSFAYTMNGMAASLMGDVRSSRIMDALRAFAGQ